MLPAVFSNSARAATTESDAKVLVVVQLDGGNDGINTVVPLGNDAYGQVRNKLRLDEDRLHKLDDHVGLHPNMKAAKELFDDGRLAIVQGVGYPNPDRSHFRSMRIWQTARFDDAEHDGYGWLGRALDARKTGNVASGEAGAIFVGNQETPVALWSRRSQALALARAEDLHLELGLQRVAEQPVVGDDHNVHQFISKQMMSAVAAADDFQKQQLGGGGAYPNTQLGRQLKLVAQLLRSGSQARVYYTSQGGYDTHSAQLFTHAGLLREYSDAVKSLVDDLKSDGLDDRVVVLAFSEFGRRVKENDSAGTDHGTAGPVFLSGSPVKGGLLGNAPNLTDLDAGDLRMQTDFRQVYATLLDQWLDVPSETVLGAKFEPLPILA
jgi:uncharacterized protein (DUF1501 family)